MAALEQVEVAEAAGGAAPASGADRPAGQVESVAGDHGRVEVASERTLACMNVDTRALAESLGRLDRPERMSVVAYLLRLGREERRRSAEVDSAEEADSADEETTDNQEGAEDEAETDADLLAKLLRYYGELTSTEQAELVNGLGKRLACTVDTATDEGGTDEGETDEEDTGRPRGLVKLVKELDGYELESSDPMSVPGPKDIVEAVLVDLRSVEMRLAGAREALEAMGFTFDWQEDDLSVEREAGLAALADAGDTIDALRGPLIMWARKFQGSRLLVLDSKTMRSVRQLASSIPDLYWPKVEYVVCGAVAHLVQQADADRIIAKAEQTESLAFDKEIGRQPHREDRKYWPFVRSDGQPWELVDGGVEDGEPTACGAETAVEEADDEADCDDGFGGAPLSLILCGFDGRVIPGGDLCVDLMLSEELLEELRGEVAALAARFSERATADLRAWKEERFPEVVGSE